MKTLAIVSDLKYIKLEKHTAKGDPGGCNNTCLNNSVFLPSEGLLEETTSMNQGRITPQNGKSQQPSCNVKGWYDTSS